MHAIRQHRFGAADVLRLEELPDPQPGAGQVRIAVEAAGVHLIDTRIRAGAPGATAPELPMTPGREVAGVVDAVGPGVAASWLGRRAVAHLGMASGGYAEAALADAERLHHVPDGLDACVAVAAIGTGRTAAGILRLVSLTASDTVIVTSAAGGLGLLFLQEARRAGARSIALAGGADKLAVARDHGADLALDDRDPAWPQALAGESPTVVLDGVGGEIGRAAYGLLVPGGRLVRFGWSSGEQNAYDDPDRPVVDVLGATMTQVPGGLAALEEEALRAAAGGTRVPYVGSVFPLAAAAEAHRALETRRSVGKVVLVTRRSGA